MYCWLFPQLGRSTARPSAATVHPKRASQSLQCFLTDLTPPLNAPRPSGGIMFSLWSGYSGRFQTDLSWLWLWVVNGGPDLVPRQSLGQEARPGRRLMRVLPIACLFTLAACRMTPAPAPVPLEGTQEELSAL